MATLMIITGKENPILRTKTKPVTKVTKEITSLIEDMRDTVIAANGAGLAAPQVGRSERVCLVQIEKKLIPLINPEILWRDPIAVLGEEGCLSLPGLWLQVPRSVAITLRYIDTLGKEQERRYKNFAARVIQHELDHLDGILITDYQQNKE